MGYVTIKHRDIMGIQLDKPIWDFPSFYQAQNGDFPAMFHDPLKKGAKSDQKIGND
jgi:hypothetical protein